MEDIVTPETANQLITGNNKALFTPDQIEYLQQQEANGLAKFILFMYKLQHKKERTPEMKQLLEDAHKLKCEFATYILGEIHEAQKNYNRAFDYYTTAHVYNYPRATVKLGECYMNGIGVRQDTVRAKRLFQLAFTKDEPYGALHCGILDEREYNKKSAERWYKRAYSGGITEAAIKLGLLFEKEKPADAVDYYKKAYKKGYYLAAFYLGRLYKTGRGIDKDCKKAIELFKVALEKKKVARAAVELGHSYDKGLGVEKDFDRATGYYAQAIQLDSSIDIPKKHRKKLKSIKPSESDYTKL